ncbi:MAG: PLP-dependent transferase [Ignavibacteriae bacterium]|nr:PLP-dependent transferase [Ignavibacteriota bacterium]
MTIPKHVNSKRKATKAIHGGKLLCADFGQVSVPIFQSSTFAFPTAEDGAARFAGEQAGYIYTRLGNPTVNALEQSIADQESGYKGLATGSGMAAITTVYAAFLEAGAHIVSTDCVYGPSRGALETIFARFGVESSFVDTSDLQNIEQAIRPNTKLVFIETPANPTMKITDIAGAAAIAQKHGIPLAVDNTFASPYLQRPIEKGADIVVHSLTKYINGHSDIVGGMIITKNAELYRKIKPVLNHLGGTMDPHQAWLVLRGVQTLSLRMEKSQENAAKLAEFLRHHPKVTWVNYPGFTDHPQYKIAKCQMDGFGAMIAIGVVNGLEGGKTVMNNVQVFTLAVSLGGVESLIEHPASMTHASVPRKHREEAGLYDELVRISVGCEDYEDLRDDLDQALNKI